MGGLSLRPQLVSALAAVARLLVSPPPPSTVLAFASSGKHSSRHHRPLVKIGPGVCILSSMRAPKWRAQGGNLSCVSLLPLLTSLTMRSHPEQLASSPLPRNPRLLFRAAPGRHARGTSLHQYPHPTASITGFPTCAAAISQSSPPPWQMPEKLLKSLGHPPRPTRSPRRVPTDRPFTCVCERAWYNAAEASINKRTYV